MKTIQINSDTKRHLKSRYWKYRKKGYSHEVALKQSRKMKLGSFPKKVIKW